MAWQELQFDEAAIIDGLERWAAIESPTWDAVAVNRMMDLAGRELALLGAYIERIPGRMGLGDCVRARFPHHLPDGTRHCHVN
jgi:glutamate carboxypeptidase